LIFCFEKAGSLHKWPKLWKEDGCRRPASGPGEGRKKTKSRREEKLLNRFLKLLKNVRCEPEPFSTCSCDFGTKKKIKPQVNGLGFLHQLLRKSILGRGMKMGLNRGPNSRTFNKRNEEI
jgi:hypothetical protein